MPTTTAMATSKGARKLRRSRLPKWLRHRTLIAAEVLALAGVAKYELTPFVKAQETVPNWGKVLFLLAATVGIFGVLFLALERLLRRSVERTQEVIQALPLPAPLVLFHLAAWSGLFLLYAWVYALPLR